MVTYSSILDWRSPWTEESGGLQFTWPKESDTTEQLNTHWCLTNANSEYYYSLLLQLLIPLLLFLEVNYL